MEEREYWIEGPGGRQFAKSWTPRETLSRSPVILFHDSLGSVALWRDFPKMLARATGRRVIAYDRLGFGRSDARRDRVSRDFIGEEAERYVPALCAHLGIDRFVACGHSVGGGMAVETGARLGERCDAVATIAAQAFVENRTLEGIRRARIDFASPDNRARLTKYHGDKADWVLRAWIETWLAPEFADWSLESALRQVHCPLLAVHGEHDEYGSTEHPRRIAAGRGEMIVLSGAGHTPHRECPDRLVDVLRPFIESAAAARTA